MLFSHLRTCCFVASEEGSPEVHYGPAAAQEELESGENCFIDKFINFEGHREEHTSNWSTESP